jgi:hypothetical protein
MEWHRHQGGRAFAASCVSAAPLHALVQGTGLALRLSAPNFRRELRSLPQLRTALLRYFCVLLRQVAQMAACTRYHTVEQRLARWLLMTQDRAPGAEFHLTHDFLGRLLGVRRVGATHAAGALKRNGLIAYRRGEVVVVSRRGLQSASCHCYASDKRLYQRTLGQRQLGCRRLGPPHLQQCSVQGSPAILTCFWVTLIPPTRIQR